MIAHDYKSRVYMDRYSACDAITEILASVGAAFLVALVWWALL